MLSVEVAGLDFPNPVGLAAGFDKDAEVFRQMLGFGFGFVEVGTLTPRPQPGNPRPRLFRLAEDRAVINRMGFNNRGPERGAGAAAEAGRRGGPRRRQYRRQQGQRATAIADYVGRACAAMTGVADYLTVNISSPNTPGLRGLAGRGRARRAARRRSIEARGAGPPIFLKVAPDLEPGADRRHRPRSRSTRKIDALIVANTTICRPAARLAASRRGGRPFRRAAEGAGAASGCAISARATGGALPLIAAGGIESGADAFARIRAGREPRPALHALWSIAGPAWPGKSTAS